MIQLSKFDFEIQEEVNMDLYKFAIIFCQSDTVSDSQDALSQISPPLKSDRNGTTFDFAVVSVVRLLLVKFAATIIL